MKILLTVLCLLFGTVYGQTIGYMRYDTVKIFTTKPGGRGSLDVTGNVRFTGLLQKSSGTDSVVVRDVNGNLGTTAKGALFVTPTWQQTLTAGSTLTGNNTIAGGGFNFTWNSLGNMRLNGNVGIGVAPSYKFHVENASGGVSVANITNTSGGNGLTVAGTSTGTDRVLELLGGAGASTDLFNVNADGKIFAHLIPAAIGDKSLRWNSATKEVTYADTTTAGASGLTVGTTTITSGTSTRVLYNNAGVLGEYPLSNFVSPSIQNFRLTTESGVPVSITDRTAQGTIYMTPYTGNHISLYSGAAWVDHTTAEVSLALTVTSGNNYDVFAYNNAGTITLELSAAWTNDNTRADALTRQDGVLVKSGATTRRLIGTIRASASNVTEDSEGGTTTQVGGKRFVWNLYNQVRRTAKVIDQTDSWNYNTATWRQENGNTGNQIEYVTGDASILMEAQYNALVLSTNTQSLVGIGISSTTVPSGFPSGLYTSGTVFTCVLTRYAGAPGLGYFFIVPLEKGTAGTTTFYGDNATTDTQSGLSVIITN